MIPESKQVNQIKQEVQDVEGNNQQFQLLHEMDFFMVDQYRMSLLGRVFKQHKGK